MTVLTVIATIVEVGVIVALAASGIAIFGAWALASIRDIMQHRAA